MPKRHYKHDSFHLDIFELIYINIILLVVFGATKLFFGNSLKKIILFGNPVIDSVFLIIVTLYFFYWIISEINKYSWHKKIIKSVNNTALRCPRCNMSGAINYDVIEIYPRSGNVQEKSIFDFCCYCGHKSQPYRIRQEWATETVTPDYENSPDYGDDNKKRYHIEPYERTHLSNTFNNYWIELKKGTTKA